MPHPANSHRISFFSAPVPLPCWPSVIAPASRSLLLAHPPCSAASLQRHHSTERQKGGMRAVMACSCRPPAASTPPAEERQGRQALLASMRTLEGSYPATSTLCGPCPPALASATGVSQAVHHITRSLRWRAHTMREVGAHTMREETRRPCNALQRPIIFIREALKRRRSRSGRSQSRGSHTPAGLHSLLASWDCHRLAGDEPGPLAPAEPHGLHPLPPTGGQRCPWATWGMPGSLQSMPAHFVCRIERRQAMAPNW